MRIWSLHPSSLDAKGLLAVWRETLLAKHVLEGKTKGYTSHPQLTRFRAYQAPLNAINVYLEYIFHEANARGYHFSRDKFIHISEDIKIPVTTGQIEYEWKHLLSKLKTRDPEKYRKLEKEVPILHQIFYEVPGEVEGWEKI